VYFSSNREGRPEIWRVPAEGGNEERVTRNGGVAAGMSPDGETLVYLRPGTERPLIALTIEGGRERPVASCVDWWGFAVTKVGVYYLACAPDRSAAPLHVFDLATGADRVIGAVPTSRLNIFQGMSVSPDGSAVVFSKYISEGTDLMMIDNFR
jgi:Tol biopolymer transport system component